MRQKQEQSRFATGMDVTNELIKALGLTGRQLPGSQFQ